MFRARPTVADRVLNSQALLSRGMSVGCCYPSVTGLTDREQLADLSSKVADDLAVGVVAVRDMPVRRCRRPAKQAQQEAPDRARAEFLPNSRASDQNSPRRQQVMSGLATVHEIGEKHELLWQAAIAGAGNPFDEPTLGPLGRQAEKVQSEARGHPVQ